MKHAGLNASVASLLLILLLGCQAGGAGSDAWRRAVERGAGLEGEYTNGMSWTSMSGNVETVMTQGMQITALTASGEISIRAGQEFERFYTWDGATRSMKLSPRKTRFYGKLGIYSPGSGEQWKANKGISRGVLDEAILWFKTLEDVAAWITRQRRTGTDYVYKDDGLLVGMLKVPSRKQINVEVFQIMVDGKKPQILPGSQNEKITVKEN